LTPFVSLLRQNRNYRYTWIGQVVSEVGDHFNNIAVFSLAVAATRSGMVIALIFLARAVPAILAGPLAGVVLDRQDRKRVMIASDLIRGIVAAGFMLIDKDHPDVRLLYLFSALLMLASPFFTAGRASILPSIATDEELHTANSLTQTTQWTTLTLGALLAGSSVAAFGYHRAFFLNSLSFFFSAWCISRLFLPGLGFRPPKRALTENEVVRPWHEYAEGLRYVRSVPLILGLLLVNVGWATGGGAAQILFTVFGEMVFNKGPAGLGMIWGFAGVGLLCGGAIAYTYGRTLNFENYKRAIMLCYVVHGGAYVAFSQMTSFPWALFFIALSRAGVGMSSVLNMSQLLRIVPSEFRGRVFSTLESVTWSVMMVSMLLAGAASQPYDPRTARTIGAVAGILSSTTAIFWGVAHWTGHLPEPVRQGVEPEEIEIHGEPTV
jgi:MFS family permease